MTVGVYSGEEMIPVGKRQLLREKRTEQKA
jgi:hypothetical protein